MRNNRGLIASSKVERYRTRFSDGIHECFADTTADKGGQEMGFRPHALLESALATCLNMSMRMYANNHDIHLDGVQTKVFLDQSQAGQSRFSYEVEFVGNLTNAERERLLQVAHTCPVRKTLSQQIVFVCPKEDDRNNQE
jgi:putative redox protein